MRITALDDFDNVKEGDTVDVPESQGRALIAKGLAVKAKESPQNKMAEEGANKANPTSADGKARPSSSSRPALPSLPETAQDYPGGGIVIPDAAAAAREAAAMEAASKESDSVQAPAPEPEKPARVQRAPAPTRASTPAKKAPAKKTPGPKKSPAPRGPKAGG